jgi:hypothetical protein
VFGLQQVPRGGRLPRERLPVLAGALATLVVIVATYAATGGPGTVGEDLPQLPYGAQRVLDEGPGAFRVGELVVVPAALDPGVAWTGAVGQERISGELVDLGVRGLVDHGYLPSSGDVPAWAAGLASQDPVRSDTGPLAFACTRWPGATSCGGALLARNDGEHYLVRSGLDVPADPEAVLGLEVLDLGEPAHLTLGVLPPGAVRVEVGAAGAPQTARLSEPGAVAGATLWWAVTDRPPRSMRAIGADGAVVSETDLGG